MQRGVEVAVTHSAAGVTIGALIDSMLMPKFNPNNSMNQNVLEFVMQAAMNGAVVSLAAPYLQEEDPTGGGLFFTTLYGTQTEWQKRVAHVAAMLKTRVFSMLNMPKLSQ